MARKPATPKQDAAGDLAILHPERALGIAGRTVTVREYGFVEGLRLAGNWAPVVQDLAALTNAGDDDAPTLDYTALQAVFAKHADAVLALVAQACDQPRAWVESLGDGDGQALLMTWWAVNGPFFVTRVLLEVQMRMATTAPASAMRTSDSAPAVPPTSNPSAGSRAVN